MRAIAAFAAVSVVALSKCGGQARYAGLSRKQAVRGAERVIGLRLAQLRLVQKKQPHHFDLRTRNVAAHHASDTEGHPAWLIRISKTQAKSSNCGFAAARRSSMVAMTVPCAD
jgi:hypothetical protein